MKNHTRQRDRVVLEGPFRFPAEGVTVANSGEVIWDHDFQSRIVFDLTQTTFDPEIPLKLNHAQSIYLTAGKACLAVGNAPDGGLRLEMPQYTIYEDLEPGQTLAALKKHDHPLRLSIGAYYTEQSTMQVLEEGERAEVNGRTVTGPLFIFRGDDIQEITVTEFPKDSNTSLLEKGGKQVGKEDKGSAPQAQPKEEPAAQQQQPSGGDPGDRVKRLEQTVTDLTQTVVTLNSTLGTLASAAPLQRVSKSLSLTDEEKKVFAGLSADTLDQVAGVLEKRQVKGLQQSPTTPTDDAPKTALLESNMKRLLEVQGG